jgi:subtilase family serine protease
VIVKRKNPLDLEKMIGRHLSQEEFSEKYAADPANFDHLRDFAHKHGLTVDEGASSLARRTMVLRGPASKMEAAFGVTLNDYEKEGKKFHSYTGTISMPQEHAEPVEAVLGLDNHPIAMPHFRLLRQQKKVAESIRPRRRLSTRPRSPNSITSRPESMARVRRSAFSSSAAATTPAICPATLPGSASPSRESLPSQSMAPPIHPTSQQPHRP